MTEREAYEIGYAHGLAAFAHWKDGEQIVGTCGVKLGDAINQMRSLWNYSPPKDAQED